MSNSKEKGWVDAVEPIRSVRAQRATGFIISTILDEFKLKELNKLQGMIALDVQGYVRSARAKGSLPLMIPSKLAQRITVLKMTTQELRYLSRKLIADQKKRILVITKGVGGAEVIAKNKKYIFSAQPIHAKDAIGTGDVFLASFFVRFLATRDPKEAGRFATRFTEEFLKAKKAE